MDDKFTELKDKAKAFLEETVLPNTKKAAGKVGRKLGELSGEDLLREILKAKKEALIKEGLSKEEANKAIQKIVSRILSE